MADDIRLARIENKIDKVVDHVGDINVTLARNTDSLVEHMARTAILEKALAPIKDVYDYGIMTVKIIGVLALLGTITEGIIALLSYIHGR